MSDSLRLPEGGAWIDRSQPVRFQFEGRSYAGFAGDTLSSALWANGVKTLGRSFKYHRPRGVWGAADVDCNVMVDSADRSMLRGDQTRITDGLSVGTVNTWGGVERDFLGLLDHVGAFTPVGFYYKAFHKPKWLFRWWEERLRSVAGLGRIHPENRVQPTPKDYAWCDVLVIGAGPAGLSAAWAAAGAGADVLLVDENPQLGGSLLYDREDAIRPGDKRGLELLGLIADHPRITVRTGTRAAAMYTDNWVALVGETHMTKCRAKTVIVCSGAYEQPAVFRHNDLPGVMLASGAQRLQELYGVMPGQRAVVLTANTAGYRAAIQAQASGLAIAAIVDMRPDPDCLSWVEELGFTGQADPLHGAPRFRHAVVREAHGDRHGLRGVTLAPADDPYADGDEIACDTLLMSVGYMPADGLIRQAQGQMIYDETLQQFVPGRLPAGIFAAGKVNGTHTLGDRLADGEAAGHEAAAYLGLQQSQSERPQHRGSAPSHPYPIVPHEKGKNFIDLDEDLQLKDFQNAAQEGFDNPELLKRYSTVGMGPSQGKHSNLNALRILTGIRGESMADKQLTTARPMVSPVPLSHLAGRGFLPRKQTPMHARHVAADAELMVAASWWRPEYYRVAGLERLACIRAEATHVREAVGLIDVGTLGKLEIVGPDAVAFIEAMYTGRFAKLPVGMTRYGVACDETGVLIDDGMIARLAENHFYVSTTTSGADRMYREFQRWAMMLRLTVTIANVTDSYGAMNLAGPLSRQVLAQLTDLDLSADAFPYLACRQATVAGVPARLARVGFVGEWGYEIHVPADGALAVWDAIMAAGESAGIRPFGVEAQRLLRLEKGHIIVSQDTDGLTHPYEADLAWAVKLKKPFFIGQRSLQILQAKEQTRRLVGFTMDAPLEQMPKECHLVISGEAIAGRVTSVAYSPTVGSIIGLAQVLPSQTAPGTEIQIRIDDGQMVSATVCALPFYDPDATRQTTEPPAATAPTAKALDAPPYARTSPIPAATGITDTSSAADLTMVDLSAPPRLSLKGPDAEAWLREHDLPVPEKVYAIRPWGTLGRVVRVDRREFLLIADPDDTQARTLFATARTTDTLLVRQRQEAVIGLSGAQALAVLAQTCGIDFRTIQTDAVYTRIAGVSCLVIPEEAQGVRWFRLLFAASLGSYMWETILAILSDLGGRPSGYDAWRALCRA